MKKRIVATCAVVAGLLLGFVVGHTTDDDEISGPRQPAAECPQDGSVTELTTQLAVSEGPGQQAQVRASAEAELSEAGESWSPDQLPLCIFANGRTQDYPSKRGYEFLGPPQLPVERYERDLAKSKVHVTYGQTEVGLQRPLEETTLDDGAFSVRFISPAVIAYRQDKALHLDIAPCRSTAGRLACKAKSAKTPGTDGTERPVAVEIVVADQVRDKKSIIRSDPQPSSMRSDPAAHTTTYTWRLADATTTVSVDIPLAWRLGSTAQGFTSGDQGDVSIGNVTFRIDWLPVTEAVSALLALVAAAGILRWAGKTSIGIRLALAMTALLAGLTIQVFPVTRWETFFDAGTWAAAAIFGATKWRGPLISAAVSGLGIAAAGAFGDLESVATLGLLVAVIAGLLAIATRLLALPEMLSIGALAHTSPWFRNRTRSLRGLLVRAALFVLIASAAAVIGDAIGRNVDDDAGYLLNAVVMTSGNNIGWVILSASSILILCACFAHFSAASPAQLLTTSAQAVTLGLLVATVAPPSTSRLAGFTLPLWILTWMTVTLLVHAGPPKDLVQDELPSHGRFARAIEAEKSRGHVLALEAQLTAGTANLTELETSNAAHRAAFPDDLAADLFRRGPGSGWLPNARTAAWLGTALSLVPVGYYVFGVLGTLPGRLPYNGLFYLAMDVLAEFARWIALAFAFGALYRRLPGRIGATKGAALGIAWMAAAGLANLITQWTQASSPGLWLYLSFQTIVFLIALGAVYDLTTIERAGGSWRRLTDLYRIHTIRQRVAYLAPLVLALIGLADQIRTGAPGELAEQLLTGLGSLAG
ncbi:DUF6185 family protein [Kribbella sp. NPDC023855]|uniref:DUF6185 family protein n=1 Tax=Kribbella sp. NPDC023855 TaxID=3154698 RepID=UPI00340E6B61